MLTLRAARLKAVMSLGLSSARSTLQTRSCFSNMPIPSMLFPNRVLEASAKQNADTDHHGTADV